MPTAALAENPRFSVEAEPAERFGEAAGAGQRIRLKGTASFADAPEVWRALQEARARMQVEVSTEIDVSALERVDGSTVALLVSLRASLTHDGQGAEFVGARGQVAELLRLYGGDREVMPRRRRRAKGTLDQVGAAALNIAHELKLSFAFVGQLARASVGVVRSPRTVNWADLPQVMERTGADALVIVVMINFLVGLVMAFQAAPQLKQLGANQLVANLIGISMTRELGPLMTAIVVTGRSGAALAAELGSMRVNEEIDALRTMGLSVLRFIVLPRTIGIALVMPALTLFADLMGVLGGLVVGIHVLDMTTTSYFNQIQQSVSAWDVFSGAAKSVVFGIAIALIASQQGLSTDGGAEGVGRRTTAAVVASLFALIFIDALFTVVFRAIGL